MNIITGEIYKTPQTIADALERGEPLEPIGPRVAELDKNARLFREVFGSNQQAETAEQHYANLQAELNRNMVNRNKK